MDFNLPFRAFNFSVSNLWPRFVASLPTWNDPSLQTIQFSAVSQVPLTQQNGRAPSRMNIYARQIDQLVGKFKFSGFGLGYPDSLKLLQFGKSLGFWMENGKCIEQNINRFLKHHQHKKKKKQSFGERNLVWAWASFSTMHDLYLYLTNFCHWKKKLENQWLKIE